MNPEERAGHPEAHPKNATLCGGVQVRGQLFSGNKVFIFNQLKGVAPPPPPPKHEGLV